MKCHLQKDLLVDAVTRTEKVTGKNLSLDVLKNILIVAQNKKIILRATNLDIGIEINLPARVEREGTVAVPGTILNAFLANNTSDNVVELEQTGGIFQIVIGSARAEIKTTPYEDFPTLPRVSGGGQLQIPAETFVRGLRSVWYSASPSSMKPELSSVFVGHTDNEFVFTATDSFRLAEKRTMIKKTVEFSPFLLPLKNVGEIIRNLEVVGGEAKFVCSENQMSCVVGDTYITSRLIDGTFPDYKQIIPTEFETDVVLLKQELIQQMKTAHIFANRFNQIELTVNPQQKEFIITTQNSEIGESVSKLSAAITGDEIVVSFNYKYIVDGFQSIPTDSVKLSFAGIGKPLVLRGVGDDSFTYLVMPMNR